MKKAFKSLAGIFITILVILAIEIVMHAHPFSDQVTGNEQITMDEESEGGDEGSEPSAFC